MGCVSTLTMPAYINIFNPPIPDFAAATTLFCKAPGNAVFTNFSTGAPTLTHSWRFGDGGTSTTSAPSHTYTGPGKYDVTLITKDGNGCVDSTTRLAYITVANLKANFTAPSTACVNTIVTFPNISRLCTIRNNCCMELWRWRYRYRSNRYAHIRKKGHLHDYNERDRPRHRLCFYGTAYRYTVRHRFSYYTNSSVGL